MKKNLFFAAVALVALASCSSDEFVGDNTSPTANGTPGAIQFGSDASKITRATANTGTVAEMLDGQFKVYGVKNVKNNDNDAYSNVFVNYVVWNNNSLQVTTSNPDGNNSSNGWEYVGTTSTTYGSSNTSLSSEQTIKYWDYAANNYHFVAGSPVASFTYTITSGDIASATVTGLAGHITANLESGTGTAMTTNPVYIAEPVNVIPDNYQKPVTFNFIRQQSRVRVGIYETIPGYKITEIKFYTYTTGDATWSDSPTATENIILASGTANYFVGGNSASATVTYNWTGSASDVTYPNYTFAYDESGLTKANNWYGGLLSGVKAITSNHATVDEFYGTDKDRDNSGYFTVIPTPSATTAAPLLIKCDYKLESEKDNSGEVINVKGATAAVPAAFSKWAPNTSYTYIFKISDNTNGYTGNTGQPAGIYPITFDAVAIAETNAQGTITTISTPSITTYQEGSVTDKGIEYVTGKAISVTVTDASGTVENINGTNTGIGYVQVYYLGETAKTEADLQVTPPTTNAQTIEITENVLTFTPNASSITTGNVGYYAIQYQTASSPVAYAYKVIEVNKPSN